MKKGSRTGTRVLNQSSSPAAEASEAWMGSVSRKKIRAAVIKTDKIFLGKIFLVVIEILYDMEEPDYEKIGRIEAGKGVPVF